MTLTNKKTTIALDPQVIEIRVPETPKTAWEHVKAFFKYSETILLARIELVTGFITGVIGLMDWSPLMSMDLSVGFTKDQVLSLAGMMIVKGVLAEYLRRRNTVLVSDGTVMVSNAVEK